MVCTPFVSADGKSRGFMCGPAKKCKCGLRATLLCDWKTPAGKTPTCDRNICGNCTTAVAKGKDLCPEHAAEWARRAPRPPF